MYIVNNILINLRGISSVDATPLQGIMVSKVAKG